MSREPALDQFVDAMLASYAGDDRANRTGRAFVPSPDEIVAIIKLLLEVLYPGYFGRSSLTLDELRYHTGVRLATLREKLRRQVELCLCYAHEAEGIGHDRALGCTDAAHRTTANFLAQLPDIRRVLITDAQAAFDGDPAATNLDEIILAYPGFLAITVHRCAHALHTLGVKLMPRIMTEWAHARTGADLHPGAAIGEAFFLDHATGAVIGETTEIGDGVKLYQGVTLGALSHPRDARGRVIRGTKRHPTVEDGVTIYANATVLGGTTVVGAESLLGGSVFVTQSVPARSRVAMKPPELRLQVRGEQAQAEPVEWIPDFQI
jgi:serine O-acetyltransferase